VTVRQQGLYRATIALTLTGHPRDFHTAAPLTQDVIEAGKVDDHHVFPRGYLKDAGLGAEIDSVLRAGASRSARVAEELSYSPLNDAHQNHCFSLVRIAP
jgi:hypothetical protein